MKSLVISAQIREKCPAIRLGCLQAQVQVEEATAKLWERLRPELAIIQQQLTLEQIRQLPTIAHTRAAYKATGKDPARYRPSAEALLRRVISGKGLYRVNNVVDLLNFVSVRYGFSIGGYDADQIQGTARLGIGAPDEPYEAIGRGALNISGLPLFRDDVGAFGSPTSDSTRTMVRTTTQQFLLAIFSFHPDDPLDEALDLASDLLERFAQGRALERLIVR